MKYLKSYEIRQMWLDFFASKQHELIESAPLIPMNDPTLLWINAGIAPLKKYFDGREVPNNRRMANAQKSIRTNDIDNVGKTARHHTFFEMLGNFSVGDYFRKEALAWGYELLTSPKWFGFDIDKLYFTYYPTDIETKEYWITLGVSPSHLVPLEGNFWEIGEGPCGPCTEIFYDRGVAYDPENIGERMLFEEIENDRYIEIWNIVFSQFNAKEGLSRNQYKELPSKNIDTGAGLERIACVMQETVTNYETDLFYPIIEAVSEKSGITYTGQMAFKVIADHIRSVSFAIADGAILSNEGRGYVLRRILRRAIRYGKKLGINEPFLYKLVSVVVDIMNAYYGYLKGKQETIEKVIRIEEEKFFQTLETGEKKLIDIMNSSSEKVVSGKSAFLLYDTFGFPLELTEEVASEYGFIVDKIGYSEELAQQKERARNARGQEQSMNVQYEDMIGFKEEVTFTGYSSLAEESTILAIFEEGISVKEASGIVNIVTKITPFYAESGGQIGDTGDMVINGTKVAVLDTQKLTGGQAVHLVDLSGVEARVGDQVSLHVDQVRRKKIMANHSATHLLNHALRQVLGSHVVQQGSSVSDTGLRFDFNNYQNLTEDEILTIETLVNQAIRSAYNVNITHTTVTKAKEMGAQAVFGEKYGDVVRVIDMTYSMELCGGTHVSNTSEIEQFAIKSVESKGSGIFRIEGLTFHGIESGLKDATMSFDKEIDAIVSKGSDIVKKAAEEGIVLSLNVNTVVPFVPSYQYIINKRIKLQELKDSIKELDKTYKELHREKGGSVIDQLISDVRVINGVSVLITKVNGLDALIVKDLVDELVNRLGKSFVLIASSLEDKVIFVAKTKETSLHCGNLVKEAAIISGGNGGGRPDFAQAGAKLMQNIDLSLQKVIQLVGDFL
ncbi:MAG TPA: alanine--tRNA ligase [Bacilli bacterium]|nr:alanine--tRNA ligase [Bacilli bacterium]